MGNGGLSIGRRALYYSPEAPKLGASEVCAMAQRSALAAALLAFLAALRLRAPMRS